MASVLRGRAVSRAPGRIRVGIGGWSYEPWRQTFYPPDVPQRQELAYASRHVTMIEINATHYRTQSPASFARWRDETPEDFVFSVKAARYATNRTSLADAGEAIDRFVGSGLTELGRKLGPLLWQFEPTKRFEAREFAAFLERLPAQLDGVALRHALDVRHPSFVCDEFLALARRHRVAVVHTDSAKLPRFEEPTADFTYARLMRCEAALPTGYSQEALGEWAARLRTWAEAGDVYTLMINGAKERAPAAAQALLQALS